MPARTGPTGQEGYSSSSPPSDSHMNNDPFSPPPPTQRGAYYDQESDNVDYGGRRDTYASDISNPALNDPAYYDNNPGYDPYRELQHFSTSFAR